MGYRTLQACVADLLRTGRMVRIDEPVSPRLEMGLLHRRVFAAGGPALYFANTGTFPMVSNLYGSMERIEYIFRDAIEPLRRAVGWGADPLAALGTLAARLGKIDFRTPRELLSLVRSGWYARPKLVRRAAVFAHETTLDRLPQPLFWPDDGGPFITLPLVYSHDPRDPVGMRGMMRSNLGMYRVQLGGNDYLPNREVGLHYQIHRGIAAHHAAALERSEALPVNIFVGGAPAMSIAAVMPLPENVSELTFAGMLGRHRIPFVPFSRYSGGSIEENAASKTVSQAASNAAQSTLPVYAEADFCICGRLDPTRLKREGPFGDHLGYYSLAHDFPVFHVERVFHRKGAIWPFTVVGRPPQEDSMFGRFIHDIVGDAVPKKLPGVHAVRAVDEAGVHPLCLAIGSEQYVPYGPRRAAQLDTLAHAILGFGQLSLAKYLLIVAREDDPGLHVDDTVGFFRHVLERVDWRRDLHFTTETTCDTLDYSGGDGVLNRGSKLIVTVCGPPIRRIGTEIDSRDLPEGAFRNPRVAMPGVLVVESAERDAEYRKIAERWPLIVIVDDSAAASASVRDFLWTTFTRSDPARDVDGIGAFSEQKHWGCTGPLIIDATRKAHHAPELIESPEAERRVDELVDRLARPGAPLHGVF